MEKEHKMKAKWSIESRMDLKDFENSDLQKKINDEIVRQIIEKFAS